MMAFSVLAAFAYGFIASGGQHVREKAARQVAERADPPASDP
jgi:hypothetical protein